MKEFQEDSLHRSDEMDDSEKKLGNEMQKREWNLLDRKARKPFLFILLGMICLTVFISIIIVGKINTPDSNEKRIEENVVGKEDNPEIRNSDSTEVVQEGALMNDLSEEQERLDALAEESRVYCIISSAPYFQDNNSKGSLSISNPKESKYYTQVVIRTEDGKEMYVSPLIAPNEKIESDYLTDRDFKAGSYHCYAYFNYYASKDSSSYLGSMCAEINVVID